MTVRKIGLIVFFACLASVARGQVTPNLGLTLPIEHSPNWGPVINNDLTLIDTFASGSSINAILKLLPNCNTVGYVLQPQSASCIVNGSGGGAVASVFGRAGAVIAQSGDYSFGQISGVINLATQSSGVLAIANGGTGTGSPSLIAGTNITITGSWPNQTINSTGGGAVSSVFGRTGVVVAQSGDYTANQVTNAAATNTGNNFSTGIQNFSSTTGLTLPSLASIPTVTGTIAFNSTLGEYEGYSGSGWVFPWIAPGGAVSGHCAYWISAYNLGDSGSACGSGGSSAFSAITSSTNTTAAMIIGTGASLSVSGSGTNVATSAPYSGLTGSVPTWNQSTTGNAATATALSTLGTTTTVLHGNASGAPSYGSVSLTTDISGSLPVSNNGTGGGAPGAVDDALVSTSTSASAWKALGSCSGASNALTYNTSTHVFGCNTISGGGSGTVTTSGTPTNGFLSLFTGSTIIGNSPVDYNITTASTLTSSAPFNINDTSDPAFMGFVPNGIAPAVQTGAAGWGLGATLTTAGYYKLPDAPATGLWHASNSAGIVTNTLTGVAIADFTAGGTPSSSTFLRGDNTWATPSGSGNVTAGGTLTVNQIVLGSGTTAVAALGSLGTTTTVLHGNAAGAPTFGAVSLATDVTGNLPVSNLNGGASASSSTFWRGDGTWAAAAPTLPDCTDTTGVSFICTVPITGTTVGSSGSTPGEIFLVAGTGSIPALTANSAGFASPATGGTAYLFKLPATISGAGLLHAAATATGDGVNESAITNSLVSLTADVTGQLPISAVGSAGLSGTSPIAIASSGAISCTTCSTNASALTSNQLVIGGGSQTLATLGSLGTTTTVLHGNASGAPSFGAVALTTDVSGNLPNANLASQTANTVLGALTATTPSGLAVPSCSGATNALIWTSGTGFGCNTISGGGTPSFPVTVAGTVTSGGIPYFSSTTAETSSAILNTNILIKGGGAGGAPTNSSITDNGTTVSTTEALSSSVSISSGTAPSCTVGTAGAFCAGTGTGPTAASSVGQMWPNATDNNMYFNVNAGTTQHLPQAATITTAYTNSTTSPTSIVGLAFTVAASTNYVLHCHGLYKAAATGGLSLTVTGPSTPTGVSYDLRATTTLSAGAPTDNMVAATGTSYPSAIGAAVVTATTDMPFDFTMNFINGVNAGTLQLQAQSSAAAALTVEVGSTCTMQ